MAKKKSKKQTENKTMTLDEMNVIMTVPELAVSLSVKATIFVDGEQKEVQKDVDLAGIRKAREDFLENVEFGDDYDAKFVLTDDGRKWLDEHGVTM